MDFLKFVLRKSHLAVCCLNHFSALYANHLFNIT